MNLTNFIGNQSKQPRELGFVADSIRQRRSLKLIATFKTHLESRDVIFPGS